MTTTVNLGLTLPDFNTSTWHDDVNTNFQLIDAAVDALSITGAWDNSTAYSVGDRAVDVTSSRVYYCLVGHTSASSGTFEADRTANPSYWQIIPALQAFLQLSDVADSSYTGKANYVPSVNTAETGITLSPVSSLVFDTLDGNLDTNSFHIDFDDNHGIRDDSGNETLFFRKTASAVNYLELTNAATSGDVTLGSTGSDANVDFDLTTKGSGVLRMNGAPIADLTTENQTVSGGATMVEKDLGTVSSGTTTLDVGDCGHQKMTNGGASTLNPGATLGNCVLSITNNASAGALTVTGFTITDGDPFTTTNGHKFQCFVTVTVAGSSMTVKAMQ